MKAKLKEEEVLERFKKVHGDLYDYSLVKYINCKEKVIIVCSYHGEFLQSPDSHYKGSGCNICANKKLTDSKRDTNESFIKKAKEKHGEKFNYSKVDYVSFKDVVTIICPVHGELTQTPNNHLNYGCIKCTAEDKHNEKTKLAENIINNFYERYKDVYDCSKISYINNSTKVIISCKKHGDFKKTISDLKDYKGCPSCYRENANKDKRMSKEEFINNSNQSHNFKYSYENADYVNCRKLISITCPLHGDFRQRPSSHMRGRGCKRCAREYNSFKKSDYIENAKGKDTILYLIRCWNEEEEFYKIGKTFRSVKERFSTKKLMPYNYEIIHEIISTALYIWNLEATFHKKYKSSSYKPLIPFGGAFECYSINLPIQEIINYEK
jgi:hypothetical protein